MKRSFEKQLKEVREELQTVELRGRKRVKELEEENKEMSLNMIVMSSRLIKL